jgi:hypothetical protein
MRTKRAILCAVVLLTVPIIGFAQKTEVSVKKGKVIAQTATASINVEPGRKAILMKGKSPTLAVDDPMVDDLINMYKWIEEEKAAAREKIDFTSIQIHRIESETLLKGAHFFEMPNSKTEPSNTCCVGLTSILEQPRYYDVQGNLLTFELEKVDARRGYYYLQFPGPVQPGENFKIICVSKMNVSKGEIWKEGPLWNIRLGNCTKNSLNYFRIILPESAIFVDSSRPVMITDDSDGRPAVTIRNYTGEYADGMYQIAFLWPDKDGTTLADLPRQYRGLREKAEEEVVGAGRVEIAKILSGGYYEKQNTPLETLLSLYSAIVHKNSEGLLNLISPNLREIAAGQMNQIEEFSSLVVNFGFLGTPDWPAEPEKGYEHPVYLCRNGSLICELTLMMGYQNGKWYLRGLGTGRKKAESTDSEESVASEVSGGVTIAKGKTDLSAATYDGLEAGRFMRRWLFLGPIHVPWDGDGYFPDDKTSNKFFNTKLLGLEQFESTVRIGEKDYEWATLNSEYGVIELTGVFDTWFVVAFAWAQIDMAEETSAVLGIGSDDCVRVWLNGELVHENIVGRGVVPDNDSVPVTFKKGRNQLVFKILNYGGPWGFACRLLSTEPAGK